MRFKNVGALALVVVATGCNSKNAVTGGENAGNKTATAEQRAPGTGTAGAALAEARAALNAGQVDEAAAKLAKLQAEGAVFNATQAKDYRQAMSDAYDRAIEGAQKGDPKAQAALQLLRAAAPH